MNTELILTISRQYGSGGHQIGIKLAERLRVPFYDEELITLAAKRSGVAEQFFHQPERNCIHAALWDFIPGAACERPLSDKVYLAQRAVICELAQRGACVIVGRGAGEALKSLAPVLNVFIYADIELRKHRAITEYGCPAEQIEAYIANIDKKRAAYYQFYTGVNGRQMENYHLCVDSGAIGLDRAAGLIADAYYFRTQQLEGENSFSV